MYLPPLQPVVNSEILIYGDVEIHPSASIAPGVILQAAPESRIIIGADACVGMGVVLKAYGGVIDVKNGATLGAGVLIIGKSVIGSNACIGTSTTIFNASVESVQVITPGSIVGDTSRQVQNNSANDDCSASKSTIKSSPSQDSICNGDSETTTVSKESSPTKESQQENTAQIKSKIPEIVNGASDGNVVDPWLENEVEKKVTEVIKTAKIAKVAENVETPEGIAIGKVYIDELLVTLFPHKRTSNNSLDPDSTK
ncbi:MAG: hypothetical protein QNJ60_05530 [Xenococcaceae cyanobacterium MO_188.B19]|nr:hypothetical protein [Xenococcaceae cyanobacterium MO_188.B19]